MIRQQLCWVGLTVAVLAAPTTVFAKASCGQDAKHACGVSSPAKIDGQVTTTRYRHYVVFRALKGTKLRISILDEEGTGCLSNARLTCGSVTAKLLGPGRKRLGSITANLLPPIPTKLSRTIRKAGDYYVVVSGWPASATPPPSGSGPITKSVPVDYELTIKATPKVHKPK